MMKVAMFICNLRTDENGMIRSEISLAFAGIDGTQISLAEVPPIPLAEGETCIVVTAYADVMDAILSQFTPYGDVEVIED